MVYGLEAGEILVVANTRMAESVEIARYYINKRQIPVSHLVSVATTLNETMSRYEYDNVLKSAVLKALDTISSSQQIAAIVLIYGIPLKVDPPELSWNESELLRQYKKRHDTLTGDMVEKGDEVLTVKNELLQAINKLLKTDQRSAVDSELALAKKEQYPLEGWIRNPYFLGFQGMQFEISKDDVLLVSRLDGPDAATVYRVINDTLQIEKEGLQGRAFFDARWSRPERSDSLGGYQLYDLSLHRTADAVALRMETVLDNREELFAEKCCSEVALYCGWYSLGKYMDSFVWQKGSIGYHIASAECSTLKNKSSSVWCLKMLEKGVAATIGPVNEPYIQGFPLPELFFSQLIKGDLSLGESYLTSLPYLSWQMVLVGDPLYLESRIKRTLFGIHSQVLQEQPVSGH
ncbi:MAG: TIGR03790 family protein [Proteobacteria bacterium]|nr:TIGR03790 family protein [Pseudomonadota bacterium]